MGKNIRNFKGNYKPNSNYCGGFSGTNSGKSNKNCTKADVEADVKNQFNKYSNYSESQLVDEFYKEVKKQQKLGNLSPEMLQSFYNSMAPNMTAEQRKKMKNLIDSVK